MLYLHSNCQPYFWLANLLSSTKSAACCCCCCCKSWLKFCSINCWFCWFRLTWALLASNSSFLWFNPSFLSFYSLSLFPCKYCTVLLPVFLDFFNHWLISNSSIWLRKCISSTSSKRSIMSARAMSLSVSSGEIPLAAASSRSRFLKLSTSSLYRSRTDH